jgi:glycosyltransferase involved in cell wall biosynthesis
MKILIVSEVFYPENFIINDLAREWHNMGYTVEVLTQYPSYPYGYVYENYKNEGYSIEEWDGIKIHRYPFVEGYKDSLAKKLLNYKSFVNGGKKIVKKIGAGFDCIFVSQTGPLTVALPALDAKKKFGIPVAIWTLDIWPDAIYTYGIPRNFAMTLFVNSLIKRIYERCDKIFISSKRFAATINKYTGEECVYTPNWLKPVEDVESELKLDKSMFNFTFTGNISRYQNLHNTILGFERADIDGAVLNIVGNGSYISCLEKLIKERNIRNVVLHGSYPYNQMNDILTQSDALVLPLIDNDGIMKTEPFKIQSYLNAGKPIYGILGGSGKEIIEENNLGICSAPGNIDDIAKGFHACIDFAKNNSAQVKESAKRLMKTRFNKDIILKTFTDNLQSLIEK